MFAQGQGETPDFDFHGISQRCKAGNAKFRTRRQAHRQQFLAVDAAGLIKTDNPSGVANGQCFEIS